MSLCLALLHLALAAAPDKRSVAACIAASEAAQTSALAGRYHEAAQRFAACSQPECPPAIRVDCARGLGQAEALAPTVVFAVRDDRGGDLPDAVLTVDGGPALALDGKPVAIEAGKHQVRVVRGEQAVEQALVIVAGEKARAVAFVLQPAAKLLVPQPRESTFEVLPSPKPTEARSRATRVGPWVLTGVALVGGALFTGFGLAGRGGWLELSQRPCASSRTCLEADQAPIRQQLLVADVALGVGLAAAVGALVWWLLPSEREP